MEVPPGFIFTLDASDQSLVKIKLINNPFISCQVFQ